MNPKQREVFAEKLMDVGNIAAGALIFGQFFSEQGFRWGLTILGLAIMAGNLRAKGADDHVASLCISRWDLCHCLGFRSTDDLTRLAAGALWA